MNKMIITSLALAILITPSFAVWKQNHGASEKPNVPESFTPEQYKEQQKGVTAAAPVGDVPLIKDAPKSPQMDESAEASNNLQAAAAPPKGVHAGAVDNGDQVLNTVQDDIQKDESKKYKTSLMAAGIFFTSIAGFFGFTRWIGKLSALK